MAWLRCVLVFGAFIKLSVTEDLSANVTKLLGSILDEYDIRLRPNFAHQPLSLGLQLTIVSFDSISEVNMDYTVTMHLHQYWTDERLSFNSEELSSNRLVDILNLSSDFAERIWLPDTFLANDKSSFIHDVTQKNKMIRLHSNGAIVYGMRFTTTLACMMDLHHYPLDTQNCTIEIESYGYTVNDVLMYWKEEPVIGLKDLILPQFTIYKFETKDRQEKLATGDYQRLSLSIKLQRNTGYFMFQTYLPSILIVMLSWVSFWINHEATSARVTLGITTVLTMTTISTGIRSSLPRISYVKAIDIYLVVCFIFVFAALLEYAAVNYTYWSIRPTKKGQLKSKTCQQCDRSLHEDQDREDEDDIRLSPIPCLRRDTNMQRHRYARGFRLIGLEQNLIWTTNNDVQPRPMPINRKKEKTTPIKETKISVQMGIRDVNAIDRTSRFVFPITFALFNVTYWGFYVI